jgi:hypothetical protein
MGKQFRLLGCFLVFLVVSGSVLFSFRVWVESGSDQAGYSGSGNVGFAAVDDHCRLWGMVSYSFPQGVVMDQLVNFPDSLKNLGGGPDGPGNVNGWGLLYFSSVSPVVVRGQPQAYTDNAFNVAAQQLAASGNQVGMGHVRNAASGAINIPDPHPFIRERGGKTWALAHNGVLNIANLKSLIGSTYLSYFVPEVGSNWNDPNVVDTDLYLIYVIKCIEDSGWDVKRGLAEAETEIYRTDSSANANFLLSDGVEMWGYKESVDSIHPLCYKYDGILGYSAIVSQAPEGSGLGSWVSMSNFNLVEISVGTPPVLYQDIRDYGALHATPVYLLLTSGSAQGSYVRGQTVTLTVDVFNQLNPALGSTLTLTVTGPGNYGYFDFQPISVSANTVGECSFVWVVPDVAGRYVVEVGLAPAQLTAYDAAWLKVN